MGSASAGAPDVGARFAPYVRLSPPWDLYEVCKTAAVAVVLLPLRAAVLVVGAGVLWALAAVSMLGVDAADAGEGESWVQRPLSAWRKVLLAGMFPVLRAVAWFCFGLCARVDDSRCKGDDNACWIIVANHLGYLDIIILAVNFRGSFVAKGGIERAPLVGTVARALQCMFVRSGQSLTTQLIQRVQETYACHIKRKTCPGCPGCLSKIIIFPEGTTTNGTAMVPFRSGVFNAGLPVQPVAISMPYKHFSLSWESIRFHTHIFRAMTQITNEVVLTKLPVYKPSEAEQKDARLYAANVQAEIAKVLQQPIVPLNRKHKFLYHSYLLGKETDPLKILEDAQKITEEDPQLMYVMENAVLDNL